MEHEVLTASLSGVNGTIPFLHCRGSHYEVGLQIGVKFKDMIQDLLSSCSFFTDVVLKVGATPQGKNLLEQSLRLCEKKYAGYVDEIRGMSTGAEIEFDKLFMLNIDSILETLENMNSDETLKNGATGCTTIICNKEEVIIGHTEDALAELKDHIYIVSAEIVGSDKRGKECILEKFTTLCYAGTLMGYTMGFNSHGMIYSVNTVFPSVYTTGTPRSFIARALLAAPDLEGLVDILKDTGNGISDGLSLNVCFCPKNEGEKPVLYNIEVAPPETTCGCVTKESMVDVMEVQPGTCYMHCNRYLRLKTYEWKKDAQVSSDKHMSAVSQSGDPVCEQNVKESLSDETDYNYPVYNGGREDNAEYEMSIFRTVAVGIFNVHQKTWSVYTSPPATGNPVHTFSL